MQLRLIPHLKTLDLSTYSKPFCHSRLTHSGSRYQDTGDLGGRYPACHSHEQAGLRLAKEEVVAARSLVHRAHLGSTEHWWWESWVLISDLKPWHSLSAQPAHFGAEKQKHPLPQFRVGGTPPHQLPAPGLHLPWGSSPSGLCYPTCLCRVL